jgi:eukaryotic-like serine/threonine-protein kinase
MDTTTSTCPRCGSALGAGASPGGLCPRCLMEQGRETRDAETPADAARVDLGPTLEELRARFPELEIQGTLGTGGMGTVYRARQLGLDRAVALKILPAAAAKDPTWPERFAREARALARLSHPNIVGVHDSGAKQGLYYLLMEFVDGTSLRQIIQAGTTTPRQALQIVSQVCDALQYAHEEGVVHRDIKPENILIDKKGRAKIADFGLAKLLEGERGDLTLTGSHQTMGTPHYMAPEQWEKPHTVDHRADIYSLGVVFYELLTGELPLGRFAPPSHKIQVDVKLDEVVLKTLAKEPELRYQHASQIKTEVEGVSRRADKAAGEPPPGRLKRLRRRVTRALDPTTSSKKRIGDIEVPARVPLGVVLFLVACVIAAVTGSGLAIAAVVAVSLLGIFWILKHTV